MYFDIEVLISKFCTSISSISKLSLILSGPAHAGLLKAIAGCSSVVYSHGSVFNCNSGLDAGHQKSGHLRRGDWGEPAARVAGVVVADLCSAPSPTAAPALAPGLRCDHQVQAKSLFLRSSSIKPCSISINCISHHSFRWRRFQSLWSMSWVIFVPHP